MEDAFGVRKMFEERLLFTRESHMGGNSQKLESMIAAHSNIFYKIIYIMG